MQHTYHICKDLLEERIEASGRTKLILLDELKISERSLQRFYKNGFPVAYVLAISYLLGVNHNTLVMS